jgi:hypothetical protein
MQVLDHGGDKFLPTAAAIQIFVPQDEFAAKLTRARLGLPEGAGVT